MDINSLLNNDGESSMNDVPLIYKKLLDVKKDLKSIGKDQKNTFQGFKYRGIDQFLNTLKPILDKHGVGMYPGKTINYANELKTNDKGKTSNYVKIVQEYIFFAEDGSKITGQLPAEGLDTSDKATNKALAAALKYFLMQTFSVPTEDLTDSDSESPQLNGDELPKQKNSTPKKVSNTSRFSKEAANQAIANDDLEL